MWRYGAILLETKQLKKKHLQYKGWAIGNRKKSDCNNEIHIVNKKLKLKGLSKLL
jgi:hypothetical protein